MQQEECVSDVDALRNHLADRMDAYPPEEWSAPFLTVLAGLFDAQALSVRLEARDRLTLVR